MVCLGLSLVFAHNLISDHLQVVVLDMSFVELLEFQESHSYQKFTSGVISN